MKQTEIGEIPDDWQISDLKSVTNQIQNGLFFEPKRKGKGIPLINVRDMYKYSPILVEELDLFDANLNEKNIYKIKNGDLFFTRSSIVPSGIAFCNVYFDDNKNLDVVFDSHLIKATPKSEVVDPKYLYLNCISSLARKYFISVSKSAIMTTIDQHGIRNCPVLLPPIEEQIAISQVLSDTDNLIQATEQLIDKKQQIKTATMQNLLTGKIRLAEFDTKQSKSSELGEIPSDWKIINLEKNFTLKARIGWQGLTTAEYLDSGNYLLVTGTDFKDGKIDWKNCFYVDSHRYKQDSNIQLRENDVLVTKDGTIGKVAFIADLTLPSTLNSGVFVIRAKDNKKQIYQKFIFYILRSFYFENFLKKITAGSTITHLYQKDFVNFNFVLPQYNEQKAIANILSNMDKEITALNQRLTKLNDIKQGLMQNLLTGKIRLTE